MEFLEISTKEFEKFSLRHPQISFYQAKEWAKVKKSNGWDVCFVGLKDNKKIIAASMILIKTLPLIKRKMFYAPRGFLIDYSDLDLLTLFTKEVKKYAKSKKAVFVKIDPYVEYQERGNDSNVVEDGYNNKLSFDNIIKLGYKHFGFNLMQEPLQARWIHTILTKDKSIDDIMKDMESKTRQILRKNEKLGVVTRQINRDELYLFKEVMKHTSERREFIDRPLSYYENMWDCLGDIIKIYVAEADFDLYWNNTNTELDDVKKALEDRIYKKENNLLKMNEKKYNQTNKQDEETIKRLEEQLIKIDKLKAEHGSKKLLGGIMFMVYGNEVLSLFGGSLKELMQFQSAYTLHFEGVKMAVRDNYNKYNFYGITGDFRESNPLHGLYLFKKSFGGKVEELLGEFDLIISPFWYYTYKVSFKLYMGVKRLLMKIK